MTPGLITAQKRHVIDVTEQSFRQEVLDRSREVPVVVDFWAPWCGPCRTLGPILERLAAEGNGAFVLAKLNVDTSPRLAQMFQVQGIPAVKAFRDGRVVDEFTGALPESQVRTWLKRVAAPPRSPVDALVEQAAALEEQQPDVAISRYREILAQDAQHEAANLGLGRLLVRNGDTEGVEILKRLAVGTAMYAQAQAWITLAEYLAEADTSDLFELLGRVEQNPADSEARYQLAAHQVRNQRMAEAIGNLLSIIELDRA
ncbi:MAG TPA: tetratricopeptide repeat protein, partial [Roseiflexaceae bacterium]|nr:tetratricopeptide repeat protein [Roseiflexaceae bacterium]